MYTIVKTDNLKWKYGKVKNAYCTYEGYTIYNKNLGYSSFDGEKPYTPLGNRKALKEILKNENVKDIFPYWIKSIDN